MDVVSFGETMLRLSPPYGEKLEEAHTFISYVGGTESNTLACLARLGQKVTWVSALPSNPLGKRVEAEIRHHGVQVQAVWAAPDTRLGLFYAQEAPNPLGLQVYYDRRYSACALIDPEAVNISVVDDARLLHLTGITPALGPLAREVWIRFLQRAREKGVPLSFDVNYRSKLWNTNEAVRGIEEACQQASLLFCTYTDATLLWGFTGDAESAARRIVQRFSRPGVPKTVVLTLGSEGAAQVQDDVYSVEPAFPTEGKERFGSGDAFAAGYLSAYLEGQPYLSLRKTYGTTPLAVGNACAALKRCIRGDIASITPLDIQTVIQQREGRQFR